MSYDSKCYDLAAAFLADLPDIDTEINRCELAQVIQQTIEDEIAYKEGACELCGEARGKGDHTHPDIIPGVNA